MRWALCFSGFDMVYPYDCLGTRQRKMLRSTVGRPHVWLLGLLFLGSFLKVHGWKQVSQVLWSHCVISRWGRGRSIVFPCIVVVFVVGQCKCSEARHAHAHLETCLFQCCDYRKSIRINITPTSTEQKTHSNPY